MKYQRGIDGFAIAKSTGNVCQTFRCSKIFFLYFQIKKKQKPTFEERKINRAEKEKQNAF